MASSAASWGKFKALNPENGKLIIPVEDVNDGQAHYFKVEAEDGITVNFFVLMPGPAKLSGAMMGARFTCTAKL